MIMADDYDDDGVDAGSDADIDMAIGYGYGYGYGYDVDGDMIWKIDDECLVWQAPKNNAHNANTSQPCLLFLTFSTWPDFAQNHRGSTYT